MVSRRIYVGLLGVLAVPLTVVSLAWACVPRGALTVSPASAPSGSTVSVAASGFPRDVPVDVRWNGLSGPRLSSGVGPGFTVDITVPRVAPGAYVISAATTDEHASHSGGRAAFEVTGGADSPAPTPGQATNPPPVNPFAPTPAGGGKVITGTTRGERTLGTSGRDVIRCGGGNDVVLAGGGDDFIDCDGGNDRVNGGAGDDEIRGAGGNDNLTGGAGDDEVFGGSGNDKLFGGLGADALYGGIGFDTLRGNGGRDRLSGQGGRDILYADGVDRLARGPGDRIRR